MLLKNGQELVIQKAVPENAQAVLDYLQIVGGESDNLLFGAGGIPLSVEEEAAFISRMNASPASAMLIGLVEGEIACVGSLQAPVRERIAHQADLALSVQKKFWRQGVGAALMRSLIAFARENGHTEILHLGVRADNTRAIALYQRMGFVRIGLYPRFFKVRGEYFDEILMNLSLTAPAHIRPMMQADIDDLQAAFTRQGWQKPREVLAGYYAGQEAGTLKVFIAQRDGQAAGYCVLYPSARHGPFKGLPEIGDFNVFMPFQRQGIGNLIMDAAERAAFALCDTVTLAVGLHAGYGTAQRMYVKRGYQPDGSGAWYRDAPLAPYAACVNDDDLVLYMKKQAKSPQMP